MTVTPINVLLFGAGGRMGRHLARLVHEAGHRCLEVEARQDPDVRGALDHLLPQASLVLDFSSPEGTTLLLEALLARPVPCVIGTTGLTKTHHEALDVLARQVPLICASNFSVGLNLLLQLTAQAATALGPASFDVEIVEAHHRHKKDAPSGSAQGLVASVQAGRAAGLGQVHADVADPVMPVLFHGPGMTDGRPAGAIGVAAVRGGDVVGEHTVFFLGEGERVELSHRATDRVIFANGAWRAALWLLGRSPGRYTMKNVLGL
ncbi:MAG: 4-hydroxy-tetrahydrodipicolinate reductase [Alphaproteobacteria bacterium HGW-Alphaproteobacteria-13]|nr:MAG: 4-hydroxy-tetrahydrodipicolinate reductase [Alphaproteobacteria bacterium HGW-Alphaproteobacteria-13]